LDTPGHYESKFIRVYSVLISKRGLDKPSEYLRLISAFIGFNDEQSRSISRSAESMSNLSKYSALVMRNI